MKKNNKESREEYVEGYHMHSGKTLTENGLWYFKKKTKCERGDIVLVDTRKGQRELIVMRVISRDELPEGIKPTNKAYKRVYSGYSNLPTVNYQQVLINKGLDVGFIFDTENNTMYVGEVSKEDKDGKYMDISKAIDIEIPNIETLFVIKSMFDMLKLSMDTNTPTINTSFALPTVDSVILMFHGYKNEIFEDFDKLYDFSRRFTSDMTIKLLKEEEKRNDK